VGGFPAPADRFGIERLVCVGKEIGTEERRGAEQYLPWKTIRKTGVFGEKPQNHFIFCRFP
jgi:hypothetical protein